MKPQPIITVTSVDASARFYCDLLGVQRSEGHNSYAQILDDGEMIMQLHSFDSDDNHASLGDESVSLGNGVVLWFETDDFEAQVRRISAHNIQLDRESAENPYAKQMECWLHDPDGYQVVIAGPSPYPRVPMVSP